MSRHAFVGAALACLALLPLASPAASQDLKSFEERTTVHKLANGWTFLIVERPVAPVFSFCTLADVGSAQEVPGITGLAHMFEHMAFKGTPKVGTRDWAAEKKALAALEAAYQAWQTERSAPRPDPQKAEKLLADFRARQKDAAQYIVQNEFDDILSREGAADMNASTSSDNTQYYYSLPSNKIELFAFIESERFLHPVFREFYEERDVVQEERRMGVDSSPFGRLFEQFQTRRLRRPPLPASRPSARSATCSRSPSPTPRASSDTYYAPSNLITAIVGDVQAATLIPMLEKYFGRIAARPGPPPLRTVEPQQIAEKILILEDASQPLYLEGYHKPANTHPDQPVYDAIDDILSNGRTSRLYRSLVRDKKIAIADRVLLRLPGREVPEPLGRPGRARLRRHQRAGPGRLPRRDRPPARRGRHRRGARPLQDAREGQPGPRPAQQHGTRRSASSSTSGSMATGASCSATSTVSTRSPRPTSAAWPARPSRDPTGRWR